MIQSIKNEGKIYLLTPFFWPVSGDVEDYQYNIARILKESKKNFEVQTPDVWPDGKKIDRPSEDSYKGIPIRRLKSLLNLTWFVKLWFPKFNEDVGVIHCCGGYRHPHMFVAFLRKKKAKFFLFASYPLHPSKNIFLNLLRWSIDKTVGRYIISHSDCCFAETELERKWLEMKGAKRVVLLPNSLPETAFEKRDCKRFRQRYGIKGKMIFSLGRQVPIKNFEEIINILPELPEATLVIGGAETKYTQVCRRLAKKLGVENRVIWTGFLNSQEKKDAYAACDVFVLSSFYESRGLVVLEASAQGKPTITTSAGGLPEVVPDKFCLYEQGNKRELVEKISKLLNDKRFANALGQKAREKARKYTFEVMKRDYLKTLKGASKEN